MMMEMDIIIHTTCCIIVLLTTVCESACADYSVTKAQTCYSNMISNMEPEISNANVFQCRAGKQAMQDCMLQTLEDCTDEETMELVNKTHSEFAENCGMGMYAEACEVDQHTAIENCQGNTVASSCSMLQLKVACMEDAVGMCDSKKVMDEMSEYANVADTLDCANLTFNGQSFPKETEMVMCDVTRASSNVTTCAGMSSHVEGSPIHMDTDYQQICKNLDEIDMPYRECVDSALETCDDNVKMAVRPTIDKLEMIPKVMEQVCGQPCSDRNGIIKKGRECLDDLSGEMPESEDQDPPRDLPSTSQNDTNMEPDTGMVQGPACMTKAKKVKECIEEEFDKCQSSWLALELVLKMDMPDDMPSPPDGEDGPDRTDKLMSDYVPGDHINNWLQECEVEKINLDVSGVSSACTVKISVAFVCIGFLFPLIFNGS